jgi:hypothetical protein
MKHHALSELVRGLMSWFRSAGLLFSFPSRVMPSGWTLKAAPFTVTLLPCTF